MRCNKSVKAWMAAGALALCAGEAAAFLDTGTLLTNSASATYSAGSQGSSVSYSATAKILVANPSIYLWKDGTPTQVTASAGGLVDFRICFSNAGANTAFKLTISDMLPNNTYYWGGYSSWYTNLSGTVVTGLMGMTYSLDGGATWFPGAPGAQRAYLRWIVPEMGVGKSGCLFFTVSVGV